MIVHLVSDEKFINQTVKTFEHYYPGNNVFFVDISNKVDKQSLKYVDINLGNVALINLSDRRAADNIISHCGIQIEHVIVHSLSSLKAAAALELYEKMRVKTYWICNGADLYGWLFVLGKYELFDYNKLKNRIIATCGYIIKHMIHSLRLRKNMFVVSSKLVKQLDYFCTWNNYDYLLFNKHFVSKAQLRSFRYSILSTDDFPDIDGAKIEKNHIMVNQSASKSGNHLTVLKKIKDIDKNKIIMRLDVPISYGAENIKNQVLDYGNINLSYCFHPLQEFMDKKEYFESLSEIRCAFFGHRRQEAANNILILLGFGAKVFLRKENNLLKYFQDKGFYIYEFESQFNSMDDLEYLGLDKHKHNRLLLKSEFSQESMDNDYQRLIKFD